jgi:hypothetical protein
LAYKTQQRNSTEKQQCDQGASTLFQEKIRQNRGKTKTYILEPVPNPMVFTQVLEKSGLKPAFSLASKVAVPKLQFWNSLICRNFQIPNARPHH